jgi:hypothetical protein
MNQLQANCCRPFSRHNFFLRFMVGFGTTKFTRAWEPALLWNQLHSLTPAHRSRGPHGSMHSPVTHVS